MKWTVTKHIFHRVKIKHISILRDEDTIIFLDGAKETRMDKKLAWEVGTVLRDMCNNSLIETGHVGAEYPGEDVGCQCERGEHI